jgi:NADPH-dependent curcumin reductase CurA
MAAQTNRQFRLKQRPVGRAKPTDIDFVEAPIPTARVDEAIVQTLYLSIDPTNREQYMPLVPSRSGHHRNLTVTGVPHERQAIG